MFNVLLCDNILFGLKNTLVSTSATTLTLPNYNKFHLLSFALGHTTSLVFSYVLNQFQIPLGTFVWQDRQSLFDLFPVSLISLHNTFHSLSAEPYHKLP